MIQNYEKEIKGANFRFWILEFKYQNSNIENTKQKNQIPALPPLNTL